MLDRSGAVGTTPYFEKPRRPAWLVAYDLWRSGGSFRGFAEFAVIGAIVLAYVQGPAMSGWGDIAQSLLSKSPSHPVAAPATPDAPNFDRSKLPLAPRLRDVAFDGSYFASVQEPLRTQLDRAWQAYRERDYRLALELLDSDRADPNDRRVLLMRGVASIALTGIETFQAGIGLLERAIDQGEPKAMAILGILKVAGVAGLNRDPEGGRKLLERAAAAGDLAAMRVVGEGYISGWMGTVDPARGVSFLRRASDAGDANATFRLAEAHFVGMGIPKNQAEGEFLLLKAADAGHVEAQAMLGTWRLTPYLAGITDDPDPALRWLEKAVSAGDPHAMEYLGMFYVEYGKRTGRQDPARGVELFRRCTETTKSADCSFAYATALDNGIGVIRDPVHAYAMYLLSSADKPSAKVRARLDELEKTLSNADRTRAMNLKEAIRIKRDPSEPLRTLGGLRFYGLKPSKDIGTFNDVMRKAQQERRKKVP